jgi:hypothetical protein
MRTTSLPISFRRCRRNAIFWLLPLAACVGCSHDFTFDFSLPATQAQPPAIVTVDAEWPGQQPSAGDKLPPVYGDCVELLADGLLLACGEKPSWRSSVVVCYEKQLTAGRRRLRSTRSSQSTSKAGSRIGRSLSIPFWRTSNGSCV